METITVNVADADSGAPKVVKLGDEAAQRYRVLDAGLRSEWPKMIATLGDSYMGRRFTSRDAQEGFNFLIGQLAYQESILLTRYFTQMQYKEALAGCISYEAGEWAETVDYDVFEPKGNARWVDQSANDVPETDVAYTHKTIPVKTGGVGYSYTQQELIASAFLRRPLSERRMAAAVESYERFVDVVALSGDTAVNFTGLVNNANVTHAVRPSGKAWDGTASPTEVASDIAYAMNAIWTASGRNVVPNRVGIPTAAWEWMVSTPMSSTFPNRTVINYLRENNLAKDRGVDCQFFPLYSADGAGATSSNRVVYYDMNPTTLVTHIPMPLRFLAPQLEGYKVTIPGMFRLGPVEVRRPTNVYYQDGV
jgi:hypothetical protein